jgi:serine/threonine-protein kinase 24/25/MST4
MSVVQKIIDTDAPKLEGDQWSNELKDFVASLLVKKPNERPNCKQILESKSSFLSKARDAEYVRKYFLQDLAPFEANPS